MLGVAPQGTTLWTVARAALLGKVAIISGNDPDAFTCVFGISRTSSSDVDERMFVSFFSLVALTSRSSEREFSPTIMPS